jgi:hypothetical protein
MARLDKRRSTRRTRTRSCIPSAAFQTQTGRPNPHVLLAGAMRRCIDGVNDGLAAGCYTLGKCGTIFQTGGYARTWTFRSPGSGAQKTGTPRCASHDEQELLRQIGAEAGYWTSQRNSGETGASRGLLFADTGSARERNSGGRRQEIIWKRRSDEGSKRLARFTGRVRLQTVRSENDKEEIRILCARCRSRR